MLFLSQVLGYTIAMFEIHFTSSPAQVLEPNRPFHFYLLSKITHGSHLLSGTKQAERIQKRSEQVLTFSKELRDKLINPGDLQAGVLLDGNKNFNVELRKTKKHWALFLVSKEKKSQKDEKIICKFRDKEDPKFQKFLTQLSAYTAEELPEIRAFQDTFPSTPDEINRNANLAFNFPGTGERKGIKASTEHHIFLPGPGLNFTQAITASNMPKEFEATKKRIDQAIESYLQNRKNKDGPLLINIEGLSRGCYNALAMAHYLRKPSQKLRNILDGREIKIQLTLYDPIKGPKHNELTRQNSIPKNVSRVNIIYSRRAFLKVIDKGMFYCENPETKMQITLKEKEENLPIPAFNEHQATLGGARTELGSRVGFASLFRGRFLAPILAFFDRNKKASRTTPNQAVLHHLAQKAASN